MEGQEMPLHGEQETIGKVTLDYRKYSGQDLYCDGEVENELLRIARDLSPVEYARVIEESKSWPILYHFSPLRENIVEWLPLKGTEKVLEVGSGCGAITGVLSRKAGSVTCVELSRKRSLINAYRHSECENVTIRVGNFQDIEPELDRDYDLICLIGVFEYGQSYIGGEDPYGDFLKILLPHLKEGGRLLIAIENKYGMKYFAGCREDHLGTFFSGIEDYEAGGGVRTFSRKGLEQIFDRCGAGERHFYYPYPDYKFMTTLYSDGRLPGQGELTDNLRNFDRDRMLLFSEKAAFDGAVKDGLFPVFANSYLAVIGPGFVCDYVKYSNDRAAKFAIRTEIGRKGSGERYVRKYPLSEEAREHVRGMAAAYESLVKKYEGGRLEINRCRLEDSEELYAEFEFVEGTPLSQLMDQCLEKGDTEGFHRLFQEYLERVGYNSDYEAADYDLIFSNLLIQGETWTLIDYEWTFGKPVPVKEAAFRAVYCYLLEDEKRNRMDLDRILAELEITPEDAENYRAQEREFQKFVTGSRLAMAEIRDLTGGEVLVPQNWIHRYQEDKGASRIQIYRDTGSGYREEESEFLEDPWQSEREAEFTISLSGDVQRLRIDPGMEPCICKVLDMVFNGKEVPLGKKGVVTVNGKVMKSSYVFPTADPNISLDLEALDRQAENTLSVRLEVVRLPLDMAEEMAASVKRFF